MMLTFLSSPVATGSAPQMPFNLAVLAAARRWLCALRSDYDFIFHGPGPARLFPLPPSRSHFPHLTETCKGGARGLCVARCSPPPLGPGPREHTLQRFDQLTMTPLRLRPPPHLAPLLPTLLPFIQPFIFLPNTPFSQPPSEQR